MADWLGHLMSGWPTWAVVLAIILIIILGLAYYFIEAIGTMDITSPNWRKNRNGKK